MKYSLPLFIALAFSPTLSAQEWTGAVDSNWNNPANWNEWPLEDEDLTIDPAYYTGAMASPVIAVNSVFIPERLFIENGAVLTVQANLTLERLLIEGDGAQLNMTAGTVTTERLIAESGGTFTMSGGTVNVLSVVALGDDEAGPSSMIMNGGTMNVTGEFGYDVVLEVSEPLFQVNAGTLIVNGEAVWYSEAPGAGRGRFIINGGSATINGPVYGNIGGPLEMHIEVNGGSLTIDGPVVDLAHTTDSLIMTGGALNFNGNMIIENDGVFHGTAGEVIFGGDAELRGVGSFRFHDLTISTGAALEHNDPSEIRVSGNWVNLGSFDPDDNTVAFIGNAEQEIDATTFHGMRVANTGGGLELNGTSTVAGLLTLENGLISTGYDDLLVLLANATATSGSDASHVDGPMRKEGDDDFVFPVGDNGKWRRIGVSGITTSDAAFTVQYFNSPYANIASLGPQLISVSTTEHWTMESTELDSEAQVTLHWENASESGINGCDDLVVANWDGSAWQANVSNTTGVCTGNAAGTVTTEELVTHFEVFTFGTADPAMSLDDLTRPTRASMHYDRLQNQLIFTSVPSNQELLIVDARGSILHQQNVRMHEQTILLPRSAPGMYTAVLRSGPQLETLRFVISE